MRSPPPSSQVTWNQYDRDLMILSGSRLVPSTSPTNRGDQGGSGAPIADIAPGQRESSGRRRNWIPWGLCLDVERVSNPSRVKPTKVAKPRLTPKFAVVKISTFPISGGRQSYRLLYLWWSGPCPPQGGSNAGYIWENFLIMDWFNIRIILALMKFSAHSRHFCCSLE